MLSDDIVHEIANMLGFTATEIFRIMTEAQPIVGLINIIFSFVFIIVALLLYKWSWTKVESVAEHCADPQSDREILMALLGTVLSAVAFAIMVGLKKAVICIVLPEYAAIMQLVTVCGL